MENQESDSGSQKYPNPENNPSTPIPKRRRIRRWVYWLTGILLTCFVIFPLLVNYFADQIFGETMREIVRVESKGQYNFEYEEIRFNLFSRVLSINDLSIMPDSALADKSSLNNSNGAKFFELKIDEFHLEMARFLNVIFYRELIIEKFYLEKPKIVMFVPLTPADTISQSDQPGSTSFDHINLHAHIEDYLSLLRIDKFKMTDGYFEVKRATSQGLEVINVENISVQLANFHLDSIAHLKTEKLFFSDSLEISLIGGVFELKENKHDFTFDGLNISSAEQSIEILDIKIQKDTTLVDIIEEGWYGLNVPRIFIEGVDLRGMLKGELLLDEILISQPLINYVAPQIVKSEKKPGDLQNEIFRGVSSVFYPLEIKNILIDHAKLSTKNLFLDQIEDFNLNDLNIELFQFRVDSSLLVTQNPLLAIEDFSLSLANQELILRKAEELIRFKKLKIDTRNSEIIFEQVKLESLNGTGHQMSVDAELPMLKIVGHDFKKDLLDHTLNLNLVELNRPDINIELNPEIHSVNENKNPINLKKKISAIFGFLDIDKFRIIDAGMNFNNGRNIFKEQINAEKINLEVSGFLLDEMADEATDNVFYSSGINLEVEGMAVKLPDSIHQVSLNNLSISTENGSVTLNGIHIDTLKTVAGSRFLDGNRYKIDMNLFDASDVDFQGLYRQDGINVGALSVIDPKVKVFKSQSKKAKPTAEIPALLNNYFVGSLQVAGLEMIIEDMTEGEQTLKLLGGEVFASQLKPISDEFLGEIATDSLELSFDKFYYKPESGKQVIETDELSISKKNSLLHVKNFEIYPSDFSVDYFNKGFAVLVPEVDVSGFEIHRAIYHKEIIAQNIILDHPLLRIVSDTHDNTGASFDLNADLLKEKLLNIFQKWDLRNVEFNHSAIEAYSGTTYKSKIIEAEDFTFGLRDLYLDSAVSMTRENVLFARDIYFNLNKPIVFEGKNDQLLALGNFSLSTENSSISADEFIMTENKSSQNISFSDMEEANFSFEDVKFTGIDFFKLISDRELVLDKVRIESPVFLLKREYSGIDTTRKPDQKINFYNLISSHLLSAQIGGLEVNNASLKISNKKGENASTFLVSRVDADFRHILIDSANNVFENKFLYSDDLDLNIKDYSFRTGNGLYLVGASDIIFSSNDALLIVDSGYVKPLLNREAFAKKVGVQTDRFDMKFNHARLENFRLYHLFFHNYFWADNFVLSGFVGEDYRDKSYDRPKNQFPNLPVKGLKNLGFGVRLDTLKIVDSYFKYFEYVKPAIQPGEIWFSDINVEARNITNDEEIISKRPDMGFDVRSKLMGSGKLVVSINFDLRSDDNFRVDAVLNKMNLTEMNPFLEHVAFVKVKKGQNNLIKFDFDAGKDVARGEMNFQYKNLSIRLIDKKTLKAKGFGESVASFVANTFVVRSKNPSMLGLNSRTGKIYFQRDKTKSFFNYLAKSSLSGVSSTIRGGNEERKENRIKRKEEKKLKKSTVSNP